MTTCPVCGGPVGWLYDEAVTDLKVERIPVAWICLNDADVQHREARTEPLSSPGAAVQIGHQGTQPPL